jgi:hypothetical protein
MLREHGAAVSVGNGGTPAAKETAKESIEYLRLLFPSVLDENTPKTLLHHNLLPHQYSLLIHLFRKQG